MADIPSSSVVPLPYYVAFSKVRWSSVSKAGGLAGALRRRPRRNWPPPHHQSFAPSHNMDQGSAIAQTN